MDGSPRVNRHVFALLYAISILYLLFALTVQVTHRLNTLGEFPFSLAGDGAILFPLLAQIALLGISMYAGLYLGKSIGLGAPLLEVWAKGEAVRERAVSAMKVALVLGLAVAAVKFLLDLLVFSPFLGSTVSGAGKLPLLLLPVPLQQGIGDEIIYRLFWMTIIVWILWKARGAGDEPPGDPVYWAAILLAGLIPAAWLVISGMRDLRLVQYTIIILAGAIPFGWLYWKKGIESAIAAHFISGVALVLLASALTG